MTQETRSRSSRIVRLDPAIGLSALFRPLPKSAVRPALAVDYRPRGKDVTLRLRAPEALGVPEQTLLLSLLELAQERAAAPDGEDAVLDAQAVGLRAALWRALHPGRPATGGVSLHLVTSWRALVGRCGSQGGRSQQLRMAQLHRLCAVEVEETSEATGDIVQQSRLVACIPGQDGRQHLALHPRLVAAVRGGRYAQVSLAERQMLAAETAQAVHAFLSTVLRPGGSLAIGIDTLMRRFWGDGGDPVLAGTLRTRRKSLRDSLEALGGLPSWSVVWTRPGLAVVRRRKTKAKTPRDTGRPQHRPPRLTAAGVATPELPRLDERFDTTRFLRRDARSQPPGTMGNPSRDYRQQPNAENLCNINVLEELREVGQI